MLFDENKLLSLGYQQIGTRKYRKSTISKTFDNKKVLHIDTIVLDTNGFLKSRESKIVPSKSN
jgi:hypothetical protein